jgi:hypothetical protein
MSVEESSEPTLSQTPASKLASAGISPPMSASKFVERSLLDLDDLIQRRRLELSALRKSNKKKIGERFHINSTPLNRIKTPAAFPLPTGANIRGRDGSRLGSPTLQFDIPDEELLNYRTPLKVDGNIEHASVEHPPEELEPPKDPPADSPQISVSRRLFDELQAVQVEWARLSDDYARRARQEAALTALEEEHRILRARCAEITAERDRCVYVLLICLLACLPSPKSFCAMPRDAALVSLL